MVKKKKKPETNFILKNKQELLSKKLSQPKSPVNKIVKETSPSKQKLKRYKKEAKDKHSLELENEEIVRPQKFTKSMQIDQRGKPTAHPSSYSQNWSTTNMNSVQDEDDDDDAPLQLDLKLESIMGAGNFLQETPQKRKIPSFLQPESSTENLYKAFEGGNMPPYNLNFDQSTIRNSANNASIFSTASHLQWNQGNYPQQHYQNAYNSSPERVHRQQVPANNLQASGNYQQGLANYQQTPVNYQQAPVNYQQTPGSYQKAPKNYQQAPMNNQQVSANHHKQPEKPKMSNNPSQMQQQQQQHQQPQYHPQRGKEISGNENGGYMKARPGFLEQQEPEVCFFDI